MNTPRTRVRHVLHHTMGAALSAALILGSSTVATAGDMRLKMAGVVPVDHYGTTMLDRIKADIEAADAGLKVKVFPAGQLGSGEELLEDTIRGNVDIVHAFVYAHKDPVLEVNSLPFLVTSFEEAQKVYGDKDSAYNQIFGERLDALGLVLLGTAVEGLIGVVANEKPDNYAEIGPKNANIRVWSSNVAKNATETIGFNTTTMNWAEVFPAIQAGTVDGAICCTAQVTYTVFAQSDVGKYYIPYNAFVEISTYYASKKTWEKLDDNQRQAVQTAVDRAAADFNAWALENEATFLKKLEERGYEVLYLTDEQRGAMAEHIRANVWPGLADVVGQDVLDRLKGG